MAQALDSTAGKSDGDGGVLAGAEKGWFQLIGASPNFAEQFQKATKFDFASSAAAAKHLTSASVDEGGFTFHSAAAAHADAVINKAGKV